MGQGCFLGEHLRGQVEHWRQTDQLKRTEGDLTGRLLSIAKDYHIACLHAISLERSRFRKSAQLKSKISQLAAVRGGHRPPRSLYCQISESTDRQTDRSDRPNTVTLDAHGSRGLLQYPRCACAPRFNNFGTLAHARPSLAYSAFLFLPSPHR